MVDRSFPMKAPSPKIEVSPPSSISGWRGTQLAPEEPPHGPTHALAGTLPPYSPPPSIRRPTQYSNEELLERSERAQAVVQRHGLPNLVEQLRSGSDAEKEKAAALLSFAATHDFICAGLIVSAGGIPPLVRMLGAADGRGDEDPTIDMKEQAVKTIHDLCVGDPVNTRPVAEFGAIPPLLSILGEVTHPWSIKEAAAEALALLAYESSGGPAQETITSNGGVHKLLSCHRSQGCTAACKQSIARCLRFLAVYVPAKNEMLSLGILKAREQSSERDVMMEGLDG